jgi:hypothetical protein
MSGHNPHHSHINSKKNYRCPICLQTIKTKTYTHLSCNHQFHTECLLNHFKQECPVCRQSQFDIKVRGKPPSEQVSDFVMSDASIPELSISCYDRDRDIKFVYKSILEMYQTRTIEWEKLHNVVVAAKRAEYNDITIVSLVDNESLSESETTVEDVIMSDD